MSNEAREAALMAAYLAGNEALRKHYGEDSPHRLSIATTAAAQVVIDAAIAAIEATRPATQGMEALREARDTFKVEYEDGRPVAVSYDGTLLPLIAILDAALAAPSKIAPSDDALQTIADIAEGSTTANSLPHIAKIARAALAGEQEPRGYLFELRYSDDHWSNTLYSDTLPPENDCRNVQPLYLHSAALASTPAAKIAPMVSVKLSQDGNRPLPYDRETLGRFVREAWVRWAKTQPTPKASWLVAYDDLPEADKEADRQIGETIARWVIVGEAANAALEPASPAGGQEPVATCENCGGPARVWFAPNALWNLVKGGPKATDDPGGMFCPNCFIDAAEAAGIKPTAWIIDREDLSAETRSGQSIAAPSRAEVSVGWFPLSGDERLGRCSTEGCGGQPTWRLEAGGVGSDYCSGCADTIRALAHREPTNGR